MDSDSDDDDDNEVGRDPDELHDSGEETAYAVTDLPP